MSDIDFSNDGLSARMEGDDVGESQTVEDTATYQEPEAGVAEDAPAEQQPVEDAEPEPDPYEVRYQEAQKVIGRQGQELGELRKQVEALMQVQQQQYQQAEEQPVFRGRVPQSESELIEMAENGDEAFEAYQFALQYAPQLVPNVIAEVQAYDPAWAEQMRLDYSTRVMQAQYGPIQQQVEQAALVQQQAQVVQQITQNIAGFDQIRDRVAEVVSQYPHLMGDGSPQAIQAGLQLAAQFVRQEASRVHAQQQQAVSQQMRQQAVVETGTPAAAPPPSDENPADAIRNAIFAQDKQRRETISGL